MGVGTFATLCLAPSESYFFAWDVRHISMNLRDEQLNIDTSTENFLNLNSRKEVPII